MPKMLRNICWLQKHCSFVIKTYRFNFPLVHQLGLSTYYNFFLRLLAFIEQHFNGCPRFFLRLLFSHLATMWGKFLWENLPFGVPSQPTLASCGGSVGRMRTSRRRWAPRCTSPRRSCGSRTTTPRCCKGGPPHWSLGGGIADHNFPFFFFGIAQLCRICLHIKFHSCTVGNIKFGTKMQH